MTPSLISVTWATTSSEPVKGEAVMVAPTADANPMADSSPVIDTVRAGRFDNGKMWTFDYPPTEYLAETYGFRADEAWYERARLGALRIPGCTASFVSPNGLVMTNHHCARGAIANLSEDGENLLDTGFFARSLADERPAPSMYADQLIDIEDVTDEVTAAIEAAQTDAERQQAQQQATQAIQQRLQAQAAAEGDSIVVQVISLYQGGRFSAYTFRRYTNMKLVAAPELAMGHFGGDPDNFTFPRYALDMTFLRVYDEAGEPLQTDYYFPFDVEGSDPGELVFVIGNPGSTNRLESVAQLEFRRDVQEKYILAYLNARLAALRAEYAVEPDPQLLTQILSLSNAQKLYTGRVEGLNNAMIMARRADTERQFEDAVAADAELQAQYGTLISDLKAIQQAKREYAEDFGAFLGMQPQSGLASATLRRALVALPYIQQLQAGASPESMEEVQQTLLSIQDLPAEREERFLTIRLEELADYLVEDEQVSAFLADRSPETVAEMILAESVLASQERLMTALDAGTLSMDDPALKLAAAIGERRAAFQSAFAGLSAQEQELGRIRGRAQYDVYGTVIPPDATFSLRLADGVVQSYAYNGTLAPPYTTIYGLYDHYYSYRETDDAHEWDLPASWLEAPATLDRSTPMNLVSTNDIIGGNSGSPLLNQDLEVVGLVFDGNIEFLPSAFIYTTEEGGRTVSVDARGMLEALDEVYDLDRIVYELTTGELMPTEEEADTAMTSQP